jgi:hypothetical protein
LLPKVQLDRIFLNFFLPKQRLRLIFRVAFGAAKEYLSFLIFKKTVYISFKPQKRDAPRWNAPFSELLAACCYATRELSRA